MRYLTSIALIFSLFATSTSGNQESQSSAANQDKSRKESASTERMKWWRDARFGLFIHWGPVSLKGTEIGWSRGKELRGVTRSHYVPIKDYDNLYKQFNPVKFNADRWVQLAKDAGMKYLVFTTKHHDGFVNFDSKLTDYKITSPESPFQRDIVAELADACHRAGLRLGFYHSPPDWHHPDFRTDRHDRYIEYLHGQVRELCTNYGQVDIIWFDGLGAPPEQWKAHELIKMIRRLQPHIIINNRAGLPADFDTPEQKIGSSQIDRPWETCMTLGTQWAWKPNDNLKSLKQCIQTLVRVVGGDGNFLFNVGPMPDGRIEPRQTRRLRKMGQWHDKYGETIYGTRGGPFKPSPTCVSTRKGNMIFIHILDWMTDPLLLPAIDRKIVRTHLLTGGKAKVDVGTDQISIHIPPKHRHDIDTIVALELDGPASDIPPCNIPSGSLAHNATATASNTYHDMPEFAPDKAVDDHHETRWATDAGTHQAWLAIDLGQAQTISRALICEAYAGRVQKFELQYRNDDQWQAFYNGTTIGEQADIHFPPITAQHVRLFISKATEGPTLYEFQLFE